MRDEPNLTRPGRFLRGRGRERVQHHGADYTRLRVGGKNIFNDIPRILYDYLFQQIVLILKCGIHEVFLSFLGVRNTFLVHFPQYHQRLNQR